MEPCLKIVIDIKCLQCKTSFQNKNEVIDFVLSMKGEESIKEVVKSFFDCETIETYNCIACMECVFASKQRKLCSSPKWLCFLMSDNNHNIKFNPYIILKCFSDSKVCYWKYGLTCGTGWKKSQENNSQASYCYKCIEVLTNEQIPTIIIDSDDESVSNETEAKNAEVRVFAVDNIHEFLTEVKAAPANEKIPEPVRKRETYKRVVKRSRQLIDDDASKKTAEPSSATSSTPSNEPVNTKPPDNRKKEVVLKPNQLQKFSKGNGKKSNQFIRFRFQIDCAAATDVDVDGLVNFVKMNLKIDGKKNNLDKVAIDRRNSYVNVLAKVLLKKKYLKLLTKKYLNKSKLRQYRVIAKNNRAYKIVKK